MKGTSKVQWKMRKGEFVCLELVELKKKDSKGAMHFYRKALAEVKYRCLSLTAQL